MKKINLKLWAFLFMAALFAFTGCKDCEECATPTTAPTFTTLDISAESGNFIVTAGFSEGVYKTSDQTGNLDEGSFDLPGMERTEFLELVFGTGGTDFRVKDHYADVPIVLLREDQCRSPDEFEIMDVIHPLLQSGGNGIEHEVDSLVVP